MVIMETYQQIDEFLTQENMDKIMEYDFNTEKYQKILDSIEQKATDGLKLDINLPILENIKRLAQQFITIVPNNEKREIQGFYIYDKIYLNEDMQDARQITTIIHELTHHLYAQIFEEWLLEIFDVEHVIIDVFVMFMLNNSIENRAADEYLSYIIEGRFTPPECQNYLPFLQLLMQLDIDVEHSKQYFIFAHEISHNLQEILDKIITPEYKDAIKQQYIDDDIEKLDMNMKFDYADERFTPEETVDIMKEMILFIFDFFINGEGDTKLLHEYADEYTNN